jgi:erythromycin esterase-like protein
MKKRLWLLLALSSSAWAEPASVIRDSDLRDKPFLDATVIGQLKKDNVVDIQMRQGAWMQIKSDNKLVGWIKLLNVRTGKAGEGGTSLASLNPFKTGSSGSTVTTGVKGLSAEQLQNAQPNPGELAKLNNFTASDADAQKSAAKEKLIAQEVAYIAMDKATPASDDNSKNRRN